MSKVKIDLMVYHRPDARESIDDRYSSISKAMQELDGPFSWRDVSIPPVPVVKKGNYDATFSVKYPTKGLQHFGVFTWRNEAYLSSNHKSDDDKMSWQFNLTNPAMNYHEILYSHFPQLSAAFSSYRAIAYYGGHFVRFDDVHEAKIVSLRKIPGISIDGRNNIFTLHPAQYWDAELCHKALGYGPEEVVRRLDGQVPLVRPLMDGVYTVLNDDPDLSFEAFCAINDRFKPILGLA